ncbi:MAG: putative sugar nucleotidyl transferase [Planctomycetota bacterium]
MRERTPAVYFDDGKGSLAPLRDLRPIFEVRTGPLTIRERHEKALNLRTEAVFVPPELEPITRERYGNFVNKLDESLPMVMVVNGRCALPLDEIRTLDKNTVLREPDGDVVAARVPAADAIKLINGDDIDAPSVSLEEPVLLRRPWHARSVRDLSTEMDLTLLEWEPVGKPPAGVTVVGPIPARIHPSAKVMPGVVIDTTSGAVRIAATATIRPGAVITGPCSIGFGTTIAENAVIRANTVIGPVCKVGGEVGGTIFQGHSNKAHDGYLGDSWVGEWVNLGASTTGSNLLNTYSEITAVAEPGASRERTNETFLGSIIGDHVKTAIGTRLMTGSVIHTGAMWAATAAVSGAVERFAWVTDDTRQTYRVEKFLEVARAMMHRRGVMMSEATEARVRDLCE